MNIFNKKFFGILAIIFLTMLISSPANSDKSRSLFDHFDTHFPLTGLHISVPCSSCHMGGVFKGTPQTCVLCHNNVKAIGKPSNHVKSDNNCDDCHTAFSWTDARFEHDNITAPCSSCHNGIEALGKHTRHIATTQECDTCHITISWLNVRFDHSTVTEPCSSCHNGSKATGKSVSHVTTNQECDTCHSTITWLGARFDHSGVTGTCSSCHNGSTATGKNSGHVTTTAECDTCHTTITWLGAKFDHSGATGTCFSCHNGTTAAGKTGDHAATSNDCELCHTQTSWTNIIFTHNSIGNHNSSVNCTDCHIGNNYTLPPWQFPGYAPDCAACHADNYKTDPHKKTENPTTIFYTVDELRDCAGSCHIYDDDTFTTIKDTRNGEHQINATSF